MKRYTIVYAETTTRGSHTTSITKFKYIQCIKSMLKEVVEQEVGWSSVWFIFEGYCHQTED